MSAPPEHIVKSFDEQLSQLSHGLLKMGGMAEAQLQTAVDALMRRNSDLAMQVMEGDAEIDQLEHSLDESAVRMLALRQPMANDLREVVAVLKIANDLERIGDLAKNVAKRAIALNQSQPVPAAQGIARMARLVQAIMKETLDAYVERDPERALDVWRRDSEVDEIYTALFRELLTYMMEDARNITACAHLLFVAKNIERIGDHATNVAETIHYLVTGKTLEGSRPKSDTSSFQVVEPKQDETQ